MAEPPLHGLGVHPCSHEERGLGVPQRVVVGPHVALLVHAVYAAAVDPFVIGRKNWLFSDTPRGAEASAAVYSIVVTAKLNGLNQRAYLEWLLTEMPNDPRLREPGWIDRYLPWSEDVPASCRLTTARVDEEAALPDEPIVDAAALEAVEGTLETR